MTYFLFYLLPTGCHVPDSAQDDSGDSATKICDDPDFISEFLPAYVEASCLQVRVCLELPYTEEEVEDCRVSNLSEMQDEAQGLGLLEDMCTYGCEFADACIADLWACNFGARGLPESCFRVFDFYTDHVDDDCAQPLEDTG